MHGTGNDFILIDNRAGFFSGREHGLFKRLCHRNFGIGADGLMLIDFGTPQEFSIQYFNSDGKPADMCGNGARCAVFFVHLLNPEINDFTFSVHKKSYRGRTEKKEWTQVFWNETPAIKNDFDLNMIDPDEFSQALFVHSGVPHLILEVREALSKVDVNRWGKYFRNHSEFAPNGVNVNFIKIFKDYLQIRTFERGVEGETLACGTGALASAISADYWKKLKFPVKIFARGGQLQVGKEENTGRMWLAGPVKVVYQGSFNRDNF